MKHTLRILTALLLASLVTLQAAAEPKTNFTASGGQKERVNNVTEPVLHYTVSWLGNTFAEPDKWVQMDAQAMFVACDGTVYLNVCWEEGGRNVGIYKNGQCLGNAGYTHGWGYEGGTAVTASDKYLFIAQHVGNEGGGLKAPNTWPAKGKGWTGVSRRLRDGKGAPFAGGKGGDGDTLKSCFLPINEFAEKSAVPITGLAAGHEKLFVANASGKVRIFDPETMAQIGEFEVPRVGPITCAPDGSLWVIQQAAGANAAQMAHYSATGERLPQVLTGVAMPSALAFNARAQLLVADNSPDQQIKIFDLPACRQISTFGAKGGIFSGIKGQVGPQRLNGPVGVGGDAAGNIYVACKGRPDGNGSGLVLQSYKPDGAMNWELLGLEFVDNADVDPAADTNVYTKDEHFVMDYHQPRGQEWSYRGYTIDRFAYPDDPRLHVECAGTFARRIQGRLFLFGTDMYSDHLLIYRMTARDEIAIPCGYFAQKHLPGAWPPHQPAQGEWIWLDRNGNGAFDADEYESQPQDNRYCWGWWADDNGDVWQAGEANTIRHFPVQGLDSKGVPKYSYTTAKTEPAPEPFINLQRVEYFPATDTMYLSGYAKDFPNTHGNWKTIGKVVCRYDAWRTKKTRRWQLTPPFDEAQEGSKTSGTPVALSVAGDYLFISYLKTAEVRVYETATGTYCGTLRPGKDMSGWNDIPYAVRAHKRADGEYLIFVEEDWKAKILMYRWRP